MHGHLGEPDYPYPSELTKVSIPGGQSDHPVLIPVNELFRIDAIFKAHEYGIAERFLPSGPLTVVDVGANVGLFALYWKIAKSTAIVHCFEPAPHTFKLLRENTLHLSGIHLHPFGLADQDQTARLALHPFNTGENTIKTECSANTAHCVDVKIVEAGRALNDIGLGYIDILKIDTEGCEVEILNSLGPRLAYVGIVMLEYHSEQDRRRIDSILSGFSLFGAKASGIGIGTLKYINAKLL